MDNATIANVVAGLSLLLSVITFVLQRRNADASERRAGRIQQPIAENDLILRKEIHDSESLLQRRMSFFDIWPHVAGLNVVDSSNPVQVDVIKGVNALEMMAVCWEANVVDREVIRVAMLELYLKLYDSIIRVSQKMEIGKSGEDMLREAPIVGKVYEQLKAIKYQQASIA